MFDKELAFFIAHQDDLVAQYLNKVLVLRGESVEGAYDSTLDAYFAAKARFPLGTFMLQRCVPGPGAYTVTINSLNA